MAMARAMSALNTVTGRGADIDPLLQSQSSSPFLSLRQTAPRILE